MAKNLEQLGTGDRKLEKPRSRLFISRYSVSSVLPRVFPQGFTLIEVMLALAIFGMAALAAVKAATDHLSSVGYLQDKTFARYVASNRLAELSLTTTWPPANNVTGSEVMAGKEWFWQQQVAETAVGDFRAVNIRVSDQELDADDDEQSSIYQLSRYVGRR